MKSDVLVRSTLAPVLLLAGSVALATPPAPTLALKPAATPAPRLQFDATTIDLGNVVRGDDASAVFTYRNTGNAELKILAAKPG